MLLQAFSIHLIHTLLMSITLLLGGFSYAQQSSVKWLDFEELTPAMRTEIRPVIIQFGTPWCNYCKMMDQQVFKNPELVSFIKSRFYLLKLNAESREEIKFLGKRYTFIPSGPNTGRHQLADLLAAENGVVQYPTTVILNRQLQPVFRHQGYIGAEELLTVLRQIEN